MGTAQDQRRTPTNKHIHFRLTFNICDAMMRTFLVMWNRSDKTKVVSPPIFAVFSFFDITPFLWIRRANKVGGQRRLENDIDPKSLTNNVVGVRCCCHRYRARPHCRLRDDECRLSFCHICLYRPQKQIRVTQQFFANMTTRPNFSLCTRVNTSSNQTIIFSKRNREVI